MLEPIIFINDTIKRIVKINADKTHQVQNAFITNA